VSSAGAFSLAEVVPVPQTIWTSWNFDPVLLLALALAVALYIRGFARIARVGKRRRYPQDVRWGRAAAYFAGILTLIGTLVSPLDPLTAAVLYAHMTQYMLLTVLASVLLVVAQPIPILLRGLPPTWTRALRRWTRRSPFARTAYTVVANPFVIAGVDIGTLVFWHVPVFYQAAVRYEGLHLLEAMSFLISGLLFWWAVGHPTASPSLTYGRVLGCFVVTSLASLALGLVLFGTHAVLYPIYIGRTAAWGISPTGDQQIAGVILGVTPEMFDVLTFIVILARWVQSEGT